LTTFKDFTWDQDVKNAFAFHFWNIQFFIYFAYLVTAEWYFTFYDEQVRNPCGTDPNNLSNSPVCSAACRTIRFHLDTIAIASLIAIIQFIRVTVKYIEGKSKVGQGEPNRVQKYNFCVIRKTFEANLRPLVMSFINQETQEYR